MPAQAAQHWRYRALPTPLQPGGPALWMASSESPRRLRLPCPTADVRATREVATTPAIARTPRETEGSPIPRPGGGLSLRTPAAHIAAPAGDPHHGGLRRASALNRPTAGTARPIRPQVAQTAFPCA